MIPLLAGAAVAGTLGTPRDAMPSLPVEQPVVVPRGWTVVDGRYEVAYVAGGLWNRVLGGVRYGLSERVEVFVSQGVHARDPTSGPVGGLLPPSFGLRASLARGEAPTRSVGLVARVDCPWAPGDSVGEYHTGGAAFGVELARQMGPMRLDAALIGTWRPLGIVDSSYGSRVDPGDQAVAHLGALVQLGPLAPGVVLDVGALGGGRFWWSDGETWMDEEEGGIDAAWALTGVVQLSRGVGVHAALSLGYAEGRHVPVTYPANELGLRLAL